MAVLTGQIIAYVSFMLGDAFEKTIQQQ